MPLNKFNLKGYHIVEQVLSMHKCEYLISLIDSYRKCHELPAIHRTTRDRSLYYSVIDGEHIKHHLPIVTKLSCDINNIVSQVAGQPLVPLADEKVSCNINITPQGGSYRWHYDRNAVTAILYLNQVAGGETECYPNYRILLPKARYSQLQQSIDQILQMDSMRGIFGKQVVVRPRPGRLLIMRGDRSLHSVCPVTSFDERVAVILSYDLPYARYPIAEYLNAYLYHRDSASSSDPNYQ